MFASAAFGQAEPQRFEGDLAEAVKAMRGLIKNTRLAGPFGLICESDRERCVIPVYVDVDRVGSCNARIDFGLLFVPQPTGDLKARNGKIRVIWAITRASVEDARVYRFHPTAGVAFQEGGGLQANNPLKDFADRGEDSKDRASFRWVSVNGRGTKATIFQYITSVQWYEQKTDSWKDCFGGDPTIANVN